MDFANVTTDPAKDFGITYARGLYNDGLPQTVAGEPDADGNPTQVPNPDLSPSDSHYFLMRCGSMVDSWAAQALAANVTPPPPPGVVNGVPQEVTRRQARQALILAGKFDLVQPAISAIPDATQRALMQSEWDDSQTFSRTRPALLQMAAAIGIDAAGLDALFVLAASLS